MKKICIYGKGGIGKSTVVANVAAAAARDGKRVMVVGCDPKADTTRVLVHGRMETILDAHARTGGVGLTLADVAREGAFGVLCMESGGPRAGEGCAGKGIALALQDIRQLGVVEAFQPDLILFDVLGDVVCGGFAAPIREGYASKVLIVTSGEKMALYAANNINTAVKNFEDRSYAKVYGIVLNHRNVENEREKVQAFADEAGLPIVGEIARSPEITYYEDRGKTVVEGDPDCEVSRSFLKLAEELLAAE